MYRENEFLMRPDTASDDFIRQLLENGSDCRDKSDGCGREQVQRGNGAGKCNDGSRNRWGLYGHPLAMVYSPVQEWRSLYDNEMGLSRGTIFKELDLPFRGMWSNDGGSCCRGGCGGDMNG